MHSLIRNWSVNLSRCNQLHKAIKKKKISCLKCLIKKFHCTGQLFINIKKYLTWATNEGWDLFWLWFARITAEVEVQLEAGMANSSQRTEHMGNPETETPGAHFSVILNQPHWENCPLRYNPNTSHGGPFSQTLYLNCVFISLMT